MNSDISQVIKSRSQVNYSYSTVKITRSRIEKGLIAIPMSLAKWFPEYNTTIKVYLDDTSVPYNKTYSSYKSSTHECRIGGLAEWFKKNKIKDNDEIIIQLVDEKSSIYRLIPERAFIRKTQELQKELDTSRDEVEASDKITGLSVLTELERQQVILEEYNRIVKVMPIEERRYIGKRSGEARENVPANMRVLLSGIYSGHCQVCDFWFLKKDGNPYFEIHHLKPLKSNHPKNLILVCANCHRQFEYANVTHKFDNQNWLIKVFFNKKVYSVNQVFLKEKFEEPLKKLFI